THERLPRRCFVPAGHVTYPTPPRQAADPILGARRAGMAIVTQKPSSQAVADRIPTIDVGPYLRGASGALEATAAELRAALEEIGFFVIVNHGVSEDLIARTFAEARRFHDRPIDWKMALRMNEHNNGYMAMNRYAVWTSDVNANTKPDLNEAFFVKR